jgi:NAD(P)H-hydrate epimerase
MRDEDLSAVSENVCVTEASDVAKWLPPRSNGRDINKGTFGHVLVLAGSLDFPGAPILVAEAAARSGAGLITLAVPSGIREATMARVSPAIIARGLKQTKDATFGEISLYEANVLAQSATAVAIGSGLGQGKDVAPFVFEIVNRCNVPMVIDADALNSLAMDPAKGPSLTKARAAATVLTPHPGEMGRLLGTDTKSVQEDRIHAVSLAAKKFGCVVLLKGDQTLIADPEGKIHLNSTGNPGLASGGTGDILTGVIAAFLAQGLNPLASAAAGAYVHGLAGDLAAINQGGFTGLIATDLLPKLPLAIARCQHP